MREYLVTKFVCSKCGNNLNITYDAPKISGKYAEGEPTGGIVVQQVIVIEPCECLVRPLEDMRKAVRTLLDV
jgi:hypothetical protein